MLFPKNKTIEKESQTIPHDPTEADKSEGHGGGRQGGEAPGRGPPLKPKSDSVFIADVPSAGRARYMVPPVKSGSFPSHNLLAPHFPHSVIKIEEELGRT